MRLSSSTAIAVPLPRWGRLKSATASPINPNLKSPHKKAGAFPQGKLLFFSCLYFFTNRRRDTDEVVQLDLPAVELGDLNL